MKNIKKFRNICIICMFLTVFLPIFAFFVSCKQQPKIIKLYNTDTKKIETIDFETYIEGVVAGEIDNDYPIEAIKAQAVLARTFALKFLENDKSKYEGADISTDINEAQAYNKERVNETIIKAVKETKGKTIKYNGEYINAWFFANAGGKTALSKEGLNSDENYPYLKSVETGESSENTKNYSWTASFTKNEILTALRDMGISVSSVSSFKKGEVGESGRCLTFIIGGKEVNANTFRLNIGSTKLKSTLVDSISLSGDSVSISGRGYGHGVGLSQEYSKVLASEGKDYKEIINFFFKDVTI